MELSGECGSVPHLKKWGWDYEKCVVSLSPSSFGVTVQGVMASRGNCSQSRGSVLVAVTGEGEAFSAYPKGGPGSSRWEHQLHGKYFSECFSN